MPDGIDTYRWRGQNLVVTANEGDGREWGDFNDSCLLYTSPSPRD